MRRPLCARGREGVGKNRGRRSWRTQGSCHPTDHACRWPGDDDRTRPATGAISTLMRTRCGPGEFSDCRLCRSVT